MEELPIVYLARHGETAWSLSGQHTGRPLQRAYRTCELAGFGSLAEIDWDLVEWDYGEYEGRTSAQIQTARPNWDLFRDGCPKGESLGQVVERADRVVQRAREIKANVLLFSSGHFLRVLAGRWLAPSPGLVGEHLVVSTASLSALGYEHNLSHPVIRLWNDDHHVARWRRSHLVARIEAALSSSYGAVIPRI